MSSETKKFALRFPKIQRNYPVSMLKQH